MSAHALARMRIGLLLVAAVLVQTSFAGDLRVWQVGPDLMLLVSVCAGLSGGAEAGAWVGFFAGLLADMFLVATPVGLSALTDCLVGASVGGLRSGVLEDRRLIVPAIAFVATGAGVVVFVAVGDLLGQGQLLDAGRSWLLRVAIVESAWSAVLALPAAAAYARVARGSAGVARTAPARGGVIAADRIAPR